MAVRKNGTSLDQQGSIGDQSGEHRGKNREKPLFRRQASYTGYTDVPAVLSESAVQTNDCQVSVFCQAIRLYIWTGPTIPPFSQPRADVVLL